MAEVIDGGRLIGADALAGLVGVPASVFAYLEARVPELRAVRDGQRRAYRAADAALLAGLAELMYREAVPFRDAAAMLRDSRADVFARGEALLGERIAPAPAAAQPIPPDALVGARGTAPSPRRTAPTSPEVAAVLGELIDCVRLLEEARRPVAA